ncbi:MAG: restriction endonuclease subunit R [Leptolyngbyaceae cyanobacterium RU_5_1]|nr:restriction endonuclease subunit R [Leptolyngbyaceae cyanobacterium RU_5_1]
MVQTIPAKAMNLLQLQEQFGLERSDNPQFFWEWQDSLPELSQSEQFALDEVKQDYLHLSQYELLEPVVKLVVLSPLLKLAGFYRPPFYIAAERTIEITSLDQETLVRGQIDLLVFHPQFWIVTIEAKRSQYSLEVGIPQALAYMLGNPETIRPTFGLVTNGREFQFLKLVRQGVPRYAMSYTLALNREDDLYQVVRVLKHLGQLAMPTD